MVTAPLLMTMRKPKFSSRQRCTNWLVACYRCSGFYWTYHAAIHYQERHSDVEPPADVVTLEVKNLVQSRNLNKLEMLTTDVDEYD